MPEHDEPEQELGPKIASAFQGKADAAIGLRANGLAGEARRRVRKRRQTMTMAAAAVLVVVGIGGVWNAVGGPGPVASSSSAGDAKEGAASGTNNPNIAPSTALGAECPPNHPILKGGIVLPAGTGLDVDTPVQGLQVCRYRLTTGATMLLGQQHFDATVAQRVVNAIKVLPERNPELPVFKCTPQAAQPSEAIVLRFDTATGIREVWVQYDGCDSAGFFTGSGTYGLYSAPLKLFMVGSVRPTEGTYLNALKDW
jgi:hypothetical protein